MAIAHLALELGPRAPGRRPESTTRTSIAPERTRVSAISSACSPASGCEISSLVDIDAQLAGIAGIKRVFGVDEGAGAAAFF